MTIEHLENGAYLEGQTIYDLNGVKLKGPGADNLTMEQLTFGVEHKDCICALKRQREQRDN